MTFVSNDPSLWPYINAFRFFSYFVVASSVAVIYDWVLSFGQEVDLIWSQRWSFMTFLYLSVRYIGIPYVTLSILLSLPTFSASDVLGTPSLYDFEQLVMNFALNWSSFIVNAMLGVIMIARLYAMHQKSKRVLIFVVVVFSAITIACGVFVGILDKNTSAEEIIFSGNYQCDFTIQESAQSLVPKTWVLGTVWEIVALFLAVWVGVKDFRSQPSTGSVMGDCLSVLMKTHMLYFASFVASSCFHLGDFSPKMENSSSVGGQVYDGSLMFWGLVQMFVLGPRLILSVRELNAPPLDDGPDEVGTSATINFQMQVRMSTSSDV
ncbi:hypothetical protein CY34DRAFT_8622 [Suillus luteus UH-Slu-Lm8-n1]|uniref:DUF6533 domain-containing protein n=1 Tax=Suillus luteus UH-Slu-Lm8-n1 TaxID=930992 RepID=A0A0D0BDV7_9AGAM|nr:hypothetical protein CY34DRAFT_8622 [Suillus luteus UH-Slu-Lm8-n1]